MEESSEGKKLYNHNNKFTDFLNFSSFSFLIFFGEKIDCEEEKIYWKQFFGKNKKKKENIFFVNWSILSNGAEM